MKSKKQIIIPLIILAAGIAALVVFTSMKKPPEEKAEIDNTPIVEVEPIDVKPMTLHVGSYGVAQPKYEIDLVAQVSGQIVELSDTFVRGGFIKAGHLLARIDPNDYEAALIEAQADLATARAALEMEVAQGKVAEREWQQITNSSPTELSLRKPQLAKELARVKSAQASVLRAERNLERTKIVAPYDAMIESRIIGLGSFVGVGNNIGKLLSTDSAEIRLPVADNQLKFLINEGDKASVQLNGLYAGKDITWHAEIARGEGVIDDNSRMSYLVAEVIDPYNLKGDENKTPLRFGSYLKAEILGVSLEKGAKIPRYLVNNGRVAILDSDSKLHFTNVEIVRQDGKNVIVSSGLADGDQLIVSALDYPVEGMKVALITDKTDSEEKNVEEDEAPETQVALNENGSGE